MPGKHIAQLVRIDKHPDGANSTASLRHEVSRADPGLVQIERQIAL